MSRRSRALLLALATVLASWAGCIGTLDEGGLPSHIQVDASQALVVDGWAQDGQAVTPTNGSAQLVADNASGTGSLAANVTIDGTVYQLSADTFEPMPGKPWMGNGVNQSIDLHGDTGRGTAELPRVPVAVATWGPIVVTKGGEVLPDPLTGESQLFGHAMATPDGVRSDDDRRVTTQDGSVYSPEQAGNGQTHPGDRELHVVAKSQPGVPVYEDASTSDSGQLTPDQPNASMPVEVRQSLASLSVNVSVSAPNDAPVPPGETSVALLGPSDTELESATLGGTGNTSVSWALDSLPGAGNYSVELESDGTANWNATADVDYPEPFFLHVVFEEVSWQAASAE